MPFAEARGAQKAEDLTPELINEFARQVNQQRNVYTNEPLSKASIKNYMKAVQQLLSYLKQQQQAAVEPKRVPLPLVRKVHREILSREEVDQLEAVAPRERDKLVIRLMADTGMREGEVVSIRLDDLVAKDRQRFVRVRGKTGERMAPIRQELYRRLQGYARQGRPRDAHSNRLFLSERKFRGEWRPLGEDGVYRLFEDAADRLQFPRRAYPHLLRHSAISWMVREGMAAPIVSAVTGASIQVVMAHYFHSTDEAGWEALMKILDREE